MEKVKPDFKKIAELYVLVENETISKTEKENFKIYDMKNGIIRIDIDTKPKKKTV